MTDSTPTTTITCGKCGASAPADALLCPNPDCAVLLAAYAAPAGAADLQSSNTYDPPTISVPEPSIYEPITVPEPDILKAGEIVEEDLLSPGAIPQLEGDVTIADVPPVSETEPVSTLPPPIQVPPPSSPIADALARFHDDDPAATTREHSEADAAELHRMAEANSGMLSEVLAEVSGSKVTFGGAAVGAGSGNTGGVGSSTVAQRSRVTLNTPAAATDAHSMHPGADPAHSLPETDPEPLPQPMARGGGGGIPSWVLVSLIFLLFVIAGRGMTNLGPVGGLFVVMAVVFLLLRMAGATGRKTTSLPRDDRNDQR